MRLRFSLTSAFSLKDIFVTEYLIFSSFVYLLFTMAENRTELLLCSLTLAKKTWNSDLSPQGQIRLKMICIP